VAAGGTRRSGVSLPARGRVQVTFDAKDPVALAAFWAAVLEYPPLDVEAMHAALRKSEVPDEHLDDWAVIGDPTGAGPRVFFQKVPEGKTAKNRVHLDIRARAAEKSDRETIDARVGELLKLGAKKVQAIEDFGTYFVVMQDPEGNEFCID
jgi:hypothetical protein